MEVITYSSVYTEETMTLLNLRRREEWVILVVPEALVEVRYAVPFVKSIIETFLVRI